MTKTIDKWQLTLRKDPPSFTVVVSDKPWRSHVLSKEETDNAPTDKTEQVTSGMKQSLSFQILSFFLNKFKQ